MKTAVMTVSIIFLSHDCFIFRNLSVVLFVNLLQIKIYSKFRFKPQTRFYYSSRNQNIEACFYFLNNIFFNFFEFDSIIVRLGIFNLSGTLDTFCNHSNILLYFSRNNVIVNSWMLHDILSITNSFISFSFIFIAYSYSICVLVVYSSKEKARYGIKRDAGRIFLFIFYSSN